MLQCRCLYLTSTHGFYMRNNKFYAVSGIGYVISNQHSLRVQFRYCRIIKPVFQFRSAGDRGCYTPVLHLQAQ
jgi:hypothetical protein